MRDEKVTILRIAGLSIVCRAGLKLFFLWVCQDSSSSSTRVKIVQLLKKKNNFFKRVNGVKSALRFVFLW